MIYDFKVLLRLSPNAFVMICFITDSWGTNVGDVRAIFSCVLVWEVVLIIILT